MDIQALSEQIFITANPYYFASSITIRVAFLFYSHTKPILKDE